MMMGKNIAKKLPEECNKCSDGGWLLLTILLGMISGIMIRMMFLKYLKGKFEIEPDSAKSTLLTATGVFFVLGGLCILLKNIDADGDMFLL